MARNIRVFITICLLVLVRSAGGAGVPLQSKQTSAGGNAHYELSGCQNRQEHFISVNGVRVHYVEAGAGPTVVLIHGNAGSLNDYLYRAIGVLCGEYKLIAVDRPGHGKSDRLTKESARLDTQAKLLHATLSALGIRRPVLVGHSWGASLALAYAVHYQDDTSSIILLAPAAYADKEQGRWWMTAFIKPPIIGDVSLAVGKLLFGKHTLKKELEHAFYPQPVPDDYLKSANASWLGQKQLRSYLEDEWKLNESLKRISKRYPEIHVPMIIVTGDTDRVVAPQENAYRLKAAISQSQLIELKDMGHEIPQTDPQSIRNALSLLTLTANAKIR